MGDLIKLEVSFFYVVCGAFCLFICTRQYKNYIKQLPETDKDADNMLVQTRKMLRNIRIIKVIFVIQIIWFVLNLINVLSLL